MLMVRLAICAENEKAGATTSTDETNSDSAKTVVEYQIPKSAIYFCNDGDEAKRRYDKSKHMLTADVYRLKEEHAVRQLDLITMETPIHKFGGGSDKEPSVFAIDGTDVQHAAIKNAILAGELFVIYYHYGW